MQFLEKHITYPGTDARGPRRDGVKVREGKLKASSGWTRRRSSALEAGQKNSPAKQGFGRVLFQRGEKTRWLRWKIVLSR